MDFRIVTYPVKGSGVRYVVRDDYLFGGTKSRVASKFVQTYLPEGTKTLLYSSSYNGYGPVVTALVAKELGLKCILVLSLKAFGKQKNSTREEAEQSTSVKKCHELGAIIIFVQTWFELNTKGKEFSCDKTIWWLPLGFKDERFENLLAEVLSPLAALTKKINRIWVVGGTGLLSRALSKALPDADILLVPVDLEGKSYKKLHDHVSSYKKIKMLTKSICPKPTPYPTIQGYDSKAWDAAVIYGREGDYVFNVSG